MAQIARMIYGSCMYTDIVQHNPDWVRRVGRMLREGMTPKAIARLLSDEEHTGDRI